MPHRALLPDISGAVSVSSVMWFFLSLMIAGVAVDTTNAFRLRTMMQATADAAALAAVLDLPDADAARATALAYIERNMPAERHGTMADAADIILGAWDAQARALDPAAETPDGVRVTLRRSAELGTAVPTYLLRLMGFESWDVAVSSVAVVAAAGVAGLCEKGGFFSAAQTVAGSGNVVPEGVCLHAQGGVSIGANNDFRDGSVLSMIDRMDLSRGPGNLGVDGALRERAYAPVLPDIIEPLFSRAAAGTAPMPAFITSGPIEVLRLPDEPAAGALYVMRYPFPVEIDADATLRDVAVVTPGPVNVGAGATLENVVIVALEGVTIGADAVIGADAPCAADAYSTYVFARGGVTVGPGARLSGAQIAATGKVSLFGAQAAADAVHVEARGDISFERFARIDGCAGGLASPFGDATGIFLENLRVTAARMAR